MIPVITMLGMFGQMSCSDLYAKLAEHFELTEEQRLRRYLKDNNTTVVFNTRVLSTLNHLSYTTAAQIEIRKRFGLGEAPLVDRSEKDSPKLNDAGRRYFNARFDKVALANVADDVEEEDAAARAKASGIEPKASNYCLTNGSGLFKIGFTDYYEIRMAHYCSHNPATIRLLHGPGTRETEKQMHSQWQQYRFGKFQEWFTEDPTALFREVIRIVEED